MKIRVLEILASLRRAGAERVAVSLAGCLGRDRFDVEVVSLYDAFPNGFERVLEEKHIRTYHLGKRHGFDPRMYTRLARVMREFKPSVIHTHSYVLRYAWPAARVVPGASIVHTVHNVAEREVELFGRLIHRVAFRRGVVPIAVSQTVAASFRNVYGFDPAATIPNGINLADYYGRDIQPDLRKQWRCSNGFSEQDGLIVSVARLEEQKNPLGLVEAFAAAFRDQPRWRLLLVGDGSLLEAVRALAARRGLGSRVHLLGTREDIPAILAASDIFALNSKWEGNPVSVMEAMAAGLPVVATATGSIPELVEHGQTGLLVKGGMREFADTLANLALDTARRQTLGEAGRRRAEQFSLRTMIEGYAELFERLSGGSA